MKIRDLSIFFSKFLHFYYKIYGFIVSNSLCDLVMNEFDEKIINWNLNKSIVKTN